MGRYSIRRLRGTAPATAPAPPPTPLNVVLVSVLSSDHAIIQFDGEPDVVANPTDSNFTIQGFGPQFATNLGSGQVEVIMSFGTPAISAGDAWDMPAQPAWITNPIVVPENGICL